MRRRVLQALAFGLLVWAAPARADYAAIEFKSTNYDFTNGSWSLGYKFSVTANVVVTALGFYDANGAPLKESHQVGIYDDSGQLLVSTTVSNADALDGHFRYHDFPGIVLQGGHTYYVAAVTGSDNYTWSPTGAYSDPRVQYLSDAFIRSSTLAFPTDSVGYTSLSQVGWFGANFKLAGATTQGGTAGAPEPSSSLLLGLGVLVLGGCAWRRRPPKYV
jgi:hypothetical protein